MPHDAGLPDPSSELPVVGRSGMSPVAGRIDPFAAPRQPGTVPPGLSATPDIGAMLQALRRRWIAAVLLGGALATVAGLAAWFVLAPKQTAFAKIAVAYEKGSILDPGKG